MKSQVNEQVFYSLLETGADEHSFYSIGVRSGELLDGWSRSKERLFRLFGNKLKVSIPMETTADKEVFMESVNKLEEELRVDNSFNLVRVFSRSYLRMNRSRVEDIVENVIKGESVTVGNRTFEIGSRITKMFSALVPKELRNEFNIIYSRFLQSLQTTGQLVVSIDPVDFLTMSENRSNWSSCHSIFGEFRAGVLSYMVDEHTVVAYLSSNEDVFYEEFGIDWNNKKWRQIVHINSVEKMFIQGKHYPSVNSICSAGIKNMLSEIIGLENPKESNNRNKIQALLQDYYGEDDYCSSLHYNDILKNWDSEDRIAAVAEEGVELYELDDMIIGGKVKCLNDDCDEEIDSAIYFFCSNCVDYHDY